MIIKIKNVMRNGWKYIDEVREANVFSEDNNDYVEITKSDGSNESWQLLSEAYLLNDKGDTLNRLHK